MKQVIVIHGGEAFEKRKDYLDNLKNRPVSLDKFRLPGWKKNLSKDLGKDFDVIVLSMPNAQNARYLEWKIWFERITPLLDKEVVFVGHSLGAIFLVKYLSENKYFGKIKAVILVGAPFNTPKIHPLVDFVLDSSLNNFKNQAGKIILFHSVDDLVVPFESAEMYKKMIPEAKLCVFKKRGHFNDESFPEIVETIKNIF